MVAVRRVAHLVEPQPALRGMISTFLSEHGYEVISFAHLGTAIEAAMASHAPPVAVLVDGSLLRPPLDSQLRQLLAEAAAAELPVIALPASFASLSDAGVVHLLLRSFLTETLPARDACSSHAD